MSITSFHLRSPSHTMKHMAIKPMSDTKTMAVFSSIFYSSGLVISAFQEALISVDLRPN